MDFIPEEVRRARQALANDLHRPRYHFVSPRNWMNDPNGFTQWEGRYHLFYQHNPYGPLWGNIHWGHATSRDLVHWEDQPITLAPTPGTADEDGCWSGCFVNYQGVPTLIYSGSRGEERLPCLAVSHDGLRSWKKYEGNPVIRTTPEGLALVGYRDHTVWREDGMWYQGIGAGIQGKGGAVLLYRSKDLHRWEYLHPLLVGDFSRQEPLWTGSMWECPDFFQLGHRHVLLFSVWHEEQLLYSSYMVGDYRNHRFFPDTVRKLDYGDKHFYAPQTLQDNLGRRIAIGWVQEGRSEAAQQAAGWSGSMSLPRVLTLHPNGHLGMRPLPALQKLRGNHHHFADITVTDGTRRLPVEGDTLELIVEVEPGDAAQVGLQLRATPDGEEKTLVLYDAAAGRLLLDRTRSSQDPETERTVQAAPLALAEDGAFRLHLFLDRSVLELFTHEDTALTSRIYPTRRDSQGVALVATGGTAHVRSVDVWQVGSIWPEPGDG